MSFSAPIPDVNFKFVHPRFTPINPVRFAKANPIQEMAFNRLPSNFSVDLAEKKKQQITRKMMIT